MAAREELEATLAAIGERRRTALEQANAALEETLALAPQALEAGVPVKRIGELASVGRPTLYARLELPGR